MSFHLGASAAVCVVGGLVYALAPGKLSELGRAAFFAGLLALLLGK